MPASPARVAVVIATRNRGPELLRTLARLCALPEQPPIVVVDNGSTDGTAELVRVNYPGVQVVGLRRNHGGAAHTVGARLVDHPSPSRDPSGRRRVQVRNALWSAWLRRPLGGAARQTAKLAVLALHQPGASSGLLLAVLGLPWVLRERRPVHRELEAALRTLAG